jgi:hypothetical protein
VSFPANKGLKELENPEKSCKIEMERKLRFAFVDVSLLCRTPPLEKLGSFANGNGDSASTRATLAVISNAPKRAAAGFAEVGLTPILRSGSGVRWTSLSFSSTFPIFRVRAVTMAITRRLASFPSVAVPRQTLAAHLCSWSQGNQANLRVYHATSFSSRSNQPRLRAMSTSIVDPDKISPSAEEGKKHVARGISRLSEHVFVQGKGVWVTTEGGATLLDFTCVAINHFISNVRLTVYLKVRNRRH